MESLGVEKRKPNPKKHANFFSSLTFWWMIPIFKKGYKTDINEFELFEPLDSQRSCKKGELLESAWMVEKIEAEKCGRNPSLSRVLIKVFGPSIFTYGLRFALVEVFIKMFQPVALGQLVLYYSSPADNEAQRNIIIYSSVIVISSVLSTLIYYPTLMATFHKSLKMKVACASLIYRKSLRLSKTAMQNVTTGHIVNLISGDLNSLDLICFLCHNLWIGPLVTIIATIIMYNEIGICSLLGVFIILLTIPFQGWVSKIYASLKKRGAIKTDQRLEMMNEIIKGIQVIKMYAWEKPFRQLISVIRREEIWMIKYALYIKGLHVAFTIFRTRTAIFCSILAYVLTGNILTARKVFVMTACFNTMRHTMTDFFSFAIEQAVVAKVSIKRIEKFLLQDEIIGKNYKDKENIKSNGVDTENKKKEPKIIFKNVDACWSENQEINTLMNISMEIHNSGFIAIVGPVGCGKTTLLNIILRELIPKYGTVIVKGSISYASQEPWLYTASIQQNILFGNIYNEEKYNNVIRICSLQKDFNSFPFGDQHIIGDRGVSLSGGQKIRINLARALYNSADIYLIDDPFSSLDTTIANEIYFNCLNSFLKEKICILITHQHQYLKHASEIILLDKGEIKFQGNYESMKLNISKYSVSQNKGIILDSDQNNEEPIKESVINSSREIRPKIVEEQRKTGRVSWSVYKSYFQACGNNCYAFIVFFLFILAQFFASGVDYFLKYWVNSEQIKNSNNETNFQTEPSWTYSREFYIYSYTGGMLATIIVTLTSCFMFYNTSTKASSLLHNQMFKSIMKATMHFFNLNPAGRILNRFSKDVEIVDVILPYALINCLQTILSILGVVILITMVNPWLLLPTFVAFLILNYFRTIYLTVSSNLKRLENTTRSPVLNYVTTSLQGLSTIRAYKAQSRLQSEFDRHQDVHTTARFLNVAASRMFALWLEIICACYLALVIFSFLVFGNEYGGNVGLAITQVMSMMGSIQWGIRQSSELENHMTSVERIIEYQNLEDIELDKDKVEPPENWPRTGKITFSNVSLSYGPEETLILKDLSFSIEEQEKIGIIGRTGSGKSSIINALFHLSYKTGSICIDNINTNIIELQKLRSKISIIPQEPVLFSGSIRMNLDPFKEFNDDVLWHALNSVNLSDKNDLVQGLDTIIAENGNNFSVGQKQLLCLARAITRKNKILILDEATANIDLETDCFIQKTVKDKFRNCTILIIAHRLETIMDSEKILVMSEGQMKEFDHPYILLQNKDSYLSRMLLETGENFSAKFFECAKKNYEKKCAKEVNVHD